MSRSRNHHYKRKANWERVSRAQRAGKGNKQLAFERRWQAGDDE